MAIDRAAIERIDSTLLPQLDRHHLRVLSHCLDSFQSMAAPGSTGAIPDENQRRRWCQQQPVSLTIQHSSTPCCCSSMLPPINWINWRLNWASLHWR